MGQSSLTHSQAASFTAQDVRIGIQLHYVLNERDEDNTTIENGRAKAVQNRFNESHTWYEHLCARRFIISVQWLCYMFDKQHCPSVLSVSTMSGITGLLVLFVVSLVIDSNDSSRVRHLKARSIDSGW